MKTQGRKWRGGQRGVTLKVACPHRRFQRRRTVRQDTPEYRKRMKA